MAQAYLVDVDIERIRAYRSRVEAREVTATEARDWLVTQGGFYPRPDGWFVAELAVLQQLEPDQILDLRPVVDRAL